MTILENIQSDFNNALRNKDMTTRAILSTLIGEIKMSAKNDGNREVIDEDCIRIIRKFIKNIEDNISNLLKFERVVNKEESEVLLLGKYLPVEISEEDIIDFVLDSYPGKEFNIKDMGMIMTKLKVHYGTSLNPSVASKIVKDIVS
jgi:uncharacterized protein YqeY